MLRLGCGHYSPNCLPTFSFTTQFWASRTLRAAALTIAIHYEALAGLSRLAPRLNMRARRRMILIVPLVGAFFIDIVNALMIKFFIALPIISETPIP